MFLGNPDGLVQILRGGEGKQVVVRTNLHFILELVEIPWAFSRANVLKLC